MCGCGRCQLFRAARLGRSVTPVGVVKCSAPAGGVMGCISLLSVLGDSLLEDEAGLRSVGVLFARLRLRLELFFVAVLTAIEGCSYCVHAVAVERIDVH